MLVNEISTWKFLSAWLQNIENGCKGKNAISRGPQRNKFCITCGNKNHLGKPNYKKVLQIIRKTYLQTMSPKISYENWLYEDHMKSFFIVLHGTFWLENCINFIDILGFQGLASFFNSKFLKFDNFWNFKFYRL